jgi:hypothetical protein
MSNNIEVIDLTNEKQEPQTETVQEVGEIFTQIVNELIGLRQDLKPMGIKIIKKYTDEIDNLYNTIEELKNRLECYKDDYSKYYKLYEMEKEKNDTLEHKFEQLLDRLKIQYL